LDLRSEIGKDAKQFFREGRTLILLFAAPMVVLLVLGGVFGRTTAEIGGVTLGLCDMDNGSISNLFAEGVKNSTKVVDYSNESGCGSIAEREVREGRLGAAVVIPHGFQKGIEGGVSQNLTVYIDNSRIQTAPSVEAFLKAAVQDTGQKIGTQFISTVWGKLDNAGTQLESLLQGVNSSRAEAAEMRARLQGTRDSLASIDFSVIDGQLTDANSTIILAVGRMDSAEANLTVLEARFAEYDAELNSSESDLAGINSTLANASAYIQTAEAGMNCSDPLFIPYCFPLDSLNSTVGSAQAAVEDRLAKVRAAREGIADANRTIRDFRLNIAAARLGSKDAQARIANMSGFVRELDKSRGDSLATIDSVLSSLDDTVNRSYELESIINQSSGQIREITSKKPESVVSPMLLSPSRLFGQRTFFDFLLPSLLPMILMFVSLFLSSTSLVRDKNGGTLGRIMLSQVNPLEYCAMKVISYTVVLLPEAVMLTLIVSVVYGAFSAVDIGTSVFVFETLVLLMLAFIAIGVLIAVYSESEATAFLASLVVGLPLLFLSGLLFPFEFMPSSIALIGQASPLTQAVLSMQSVMLYRSPQAIGFGILLLYAALFTAAAAVSMKKMR